MFAKAEQVEHVFLRPYLSLLQGLARPSYQERVEVLSASARSPPYCSSYSHRQSRSEVVLLQFVFTEKIQDRKDQADGEAAGLSRVTASIWKG